MDIFDQIAPDPSSQATAPAATQGDIFDQITPNEPVNPNLMDAGKVIVRAGNAATLGGTKFVMNNITDPIMRGLTGTPQAQAGEPRLGDVLSQSPDSTPGKVADFAGQAIGFTKGIPGQLIGGALGLAGKTIRSAYAAKLGSARVAALADSQGIQNNLGQAVRDYYSKNADAIVDSPNLQKATDIIKTLPDKVQEALQTSPVIKNLPDGTLDPSLPNIWEFKKALGDEIFGAPTTKVFPTIKDLTQAKRAYAALNSSINDTAVKIGDSRIAALNDNFTQFEKVNNTLTKSLQTGSGSKAVPSFDKFKSAIKGTADTLKSEPLHKLADQIPSVNRLRTLAGQDTIYKNLMSGAGISEKVGVPFLIKYGGEALLKKGKATISEGANPNSDLKLLGSTDLGDEDNQ